MKTLKYTLLAAVSIFVAASCTKESTGDIQPSEGVDVKAVFEAVAEDDMSKALLQSNGGLQWEDGDQIVVYQTGKYNATTNRDNTANIFETDGTCIFEGTIANFHPREGNDGVLNRYVATYPADRCIKYNTASGAIQVEIPSTQTGQLSDFKKSALYFGFLRENTSYDAESQTLTFLKPFNMFCMTPVLKFNVPAELKVSKIVLGAKDATDNSVKISGKIYDFKPYSASVITTNSASSEITIENGGSVLSGDIYVALAPDLAASGTSYPQFKSSAKTLVLNLFMASGADATLQLPLTGEILAGTIKNLPALPNSVNWNYPAGPGLSAIEINKTSIGTHSARTRILLTPENTESTIKYRQRTSLSELLGATIMNDYNSENGIPRSSGNEVPENFFEIKVSTEGYADYKAYACTWILNEGYGFGQKFMAAATSEDFNPTVGSTYPVDGSYLYGLNFTYLTAPVNTETTFKTPSIGSKGMHVTYSSTSGTPAKYWSGSLNVKIPQTGKAQLIFDCLLESGSRTITVSRGGETIDELVTGNSGTYGAYRVVKTDMFEVQADDVLNITVSKTLAFASMTLLWEPEVTEASLATESYAAKTSYGN